MGLEKPAFAPGFPLGNHPICRPWLMVMMVRTMVPSLRLPGILRTNERSIFSWSSGTLRQIGQRRIAGAEIVHGETHAQSSLICCILSMVSSTSPAPGFGQLQLQPAPGYPLTVNAPHLLHKIGLAELARAE